MDIIKIIDKYGPEISKQLQIATTQVHEKVVWYVQISGVLGLTKGIFLTVLTALFVYFTHRFCKKNKIYKDKEMAFWVWFFALAIGGILLLLINLFLDSVLITNVAKIWFPDYYIIKQVLLKAGI